LKQYTLKEIDAEIRHAERGYIEIRQEHDFVTAIYLYHLLTADITLEQAHHYVVESIEYHGLNFSLEVQNALEYVHERHSQKAL